MKKYILNLIDADINKQQECLLSAKNYLEENPNDDYWLRRKQSLDNKIKAAINYREKFLSNQ